MNNDVSAIRGQRAQLLGLLLEARGQWVPLPQILELRVSQYGARIFELRRLGFRIENRRNGEHSSFRLLPGPAITPASDDSGRTAAAGTFPEFGELAPESYPD